MIQVERAAGGDPAHRYGPFSHDAPHPKMSALILHRRGHDCSVVIAMANDTEWERFCQAIGGPSWACDERFANSVSCSRHQDALDPLITAWTQQHHPWGITEPLQATGIAAGPVIQEANLFSNPHLRAHGFFQVVTHLGAGTHPYPGVMWQMSKTPATIRRPSMCLDEDKTDVYRKLPKLSNTEIAALRAERSIGMDFLGKETPYARDS